MVTSARIHKEARRIAGPFVSLLWIIDHWEIEIAAGSVWQATNTPSRFKPETGASVELEKAAMGSYWLRVDGEMGVKARRIR